MTLLELKTVVDAAIAEGKCNWHTFITYDYVDDEVDGLQLIAYNPDNMKEEIILIF